VAAIGLYLEEQAQNHREPDPHQFDAARDCLREAQMVERLAHLRLSRARLAAIRRARKLHVAEMDAHPYEDRGSFDDQASPMGILAQIERAASSAAALVKEQQKMLTAPCHDPLVVLTAPTVRLLTESRARKQARDRLYHRRAA
jgi:hypothetical protein